MTPNMNPETARSAPVYRAARLDLLRQNLLRTFESTDAAAEKVENALATFAEASATTDKLDRQPIVNNWPTRKIRPHTPRPPEPRCSNM